MPLDDEDKAFISELIGEQLKEHSKGYLTPEAATKMFEQGISKTLENLDVDGKINAAVEGIKPANKGGDGGNGGGDADSDDPALAKLRDELEQMKRRSEEDAAAREKAEKKAQEQALTSSLRDALSAAGIPAERHAHVIPYLRSKAIDDGSTAVRLDDQGRPTWVAQRKGYVDQVPLAEGIKEWVGTDDGKAFLPATGRQGTGERGGDKPRNNGGGDTRDAESVLNEALGGVFAGL